MARHILKILLCIALLSAHAALVNAATLSSTVDRNQLSTNETLTLTVSYDENIDGEKLDYSALEKDFEVLGVVPQSTSSISIINGRANRVSTTAWTITLAPKREGELTIPAFSIDNNSSQAITVKVENSAQGSGTSTEPLRAVMMASGPSVYPSEQLLIEIEITAQSDIGNLNGPELVVKGARVEALDQKSFQRVENGVASQIVVLKYAVFAENPGELNIPSLTYSAIKAGQRSFFGTRGQKVIARTEPLSVEVKELPANLKSAWFPAHDVQLRSQWSGDINALKVGEPVTRTITITAEGQQAEAIPPFGDSNDISDIKFYKDQPQLHTQATENGFIGTRIESSAIVVSKAGTLTLPALTLDWWNSKTKQWERATLPEEELIVTGIPVVGDQPSQPQPSVVTPSLSEQPSNQGLIRGLIVAVAALALICLSQFWVIMNLKRQPRKVADEPQPDTSEAAAWQKLQAELRSGEPLQLRQALMNWARSLLPNSRPPSLSAIAHITNDEILEQQLIELDKALYKGDAAFDPAALTGALNRLRTEQVKKTKTGKGYSNELKPLYANTGSSN